MNHTDEKDGLDYRRHVEGKLWKCILPFDWIGGQWLAVPQVPFRARGLMIWGAPAGSVVDVYIGTELQAVAAWGGIPAKWFAFGDSFEQLGKLIAEGKEPPAWCEFKAAEPGIRVAVHVHSHENRQGFGPLQGVQLCMWGEGIRGY